MAVVHGPFGDEALSYRGPSRGETLEPNGAAEEAGNQTGEPIARPTSAPRIGSARYEDTELCSRPLCGGQFDILVRFDELRLVASGENGRHDRGRSQISGGEVRSAQPCHE